MKKFLLMTLGALMALPVLARTFSYTYQGQSLNYTILSIEDKTVCVDETYNISGDVIIPSTVVDSETNETYTVTAIGNKAFYSNKLASVIIPNTVIEIGNRAFWYCSSLTSVTIPNSVTSIGDYAFSCCNAMTSMTIPNSVTSLGNAVFASSEGLTEVTLSSSLTTIPSNTFKFCFRLASVIIPNSVTTIERYAFSGCNLTSIKIPDTVTYIGKYGFSSCYSLTSVTLGKSLAEIHDSAFAYCEGLSSISIPNSVTLISDNAFQNCRALTSVYIPAGVLKIGQRVFSDCPALVDVYYAADQPVGGEANIFDEDTYYDGTLWVTPTAAPVCAQMNPWKNFRNIKPCDFSGVEAVVADGDAACEVYNLSGSKVADTTDALAPGIYIVRRGATVQKVAVK